MWDSQVNIEHRRKTLEQLLEEFGHLDIIKERKPEDWGETKVFSTEEDYVRYFTRPFQW